VPCATREVIRLEPTGVAPAHARRTVRQTIGTLVSDDVAHTAELLVSELVTNAITHGSGMVVVSVECAGNSVCVTVSDDDPTEPRLQPEEPMALGGRGLRMIESLASAWGVRHRLDTPGKEVWFRLP
jgi:anti-sigma regulatory factor (Ser/Thr protein kinase)